MIDLKKIADDADIIVNGYAFTKRDDIVRIINLNCPKKAAVFSFQGEVLETSMDDIELSILREIYKRNKKYIEDFAYA